MGTLRLVPPHGLGELGNHELEVELAHIIVAAPEIMHHDIQVVPEQFPVLFCYHDAESFKRSQHQVDIVIYKGEEEVDEVLPLLGPEDTDDPKIQEHDIPFLCHEQVARVGIAMEESVFKDHLEVRLESPDADFMGIGPQTTDRFGIVDPDPFDEIHDHDPGRRELPVDPREPYARDIPEIAGHPVRVPAVPREVEFLDDLVGKIVNKAGRVVQPGLREDYLHALGHRLQDTDIGLDDLGDARPLDLDRHRCAIGKEGTMDLRDRRGGNRRLLDLTEPEV